MTMATRIFGGTPGDTVADASGNVVAGAQLRVYASPEGGVRITELYDLDDNPLPGVVLSDDSAGNEGRVSFKADDQYGVLYLDSGAGRRWVIPAREAFEGVESARLLSQAASDRADEAFDVAEDARHEASAALDRVNSQVGLDIERMTAEYVLQMKVPSSRSMQSFVKDPLSGQYFATQAVGDDMVVHRCDAAGNVIDTVTCEGGGHGSSITLENDGSDIFLWFWWSTDTTGSDAPKGVRWRYSSNSATVRRDNPDVLSVPDFMSQSYTTFSIDQAADRIATMTRISSSEEVYKLYRLSDYKQGNDSPLAEVGPLPYDPDVPYQGHCTIDDYLYVHRGNTARDSDPTMSRYNWDTGAAVHVPTLRYGLASNGEAPGNFNEAEGVTAWRTNNGVPSLLFGKIVGGAGRRRALIYAFNPPLGETLSGETLRRQNQRILAGTVSVSPEPNTPTSKHVDFDWEFEAIPAIAVAPMTNQVGKSVKGVSFQNITTTGFDVYVYRETASSLTVSWIAVEP